MIRLNILLLTQLFSELLDFQVYALNFPEYVQGEFTKLEITSGVQELGGVLDFNIQFMSKANHPAKAEAIAVNIINTLDMKTNIEFYNKQYQLILIKASSPQPYFVGETEAGEYIFSTDFRLLVARL